MLNNRNASIANDFSGSSSEFIISSLIAKFTHKACEIFKFHLSFRVLKEPQAFCSLWGGLLNFHHKKCVWFKFPFPNVFMLFLVGYILLRFWMMHIHKYCKISQIGDGNCLAVQKAFQLSWKPPLSIQAGGLMGWAQPY